MNNENDKKNSAAFVFTGGGYCTFNNVQAKGYDNAFHFEDSPGHNFTNVQAISLEAMKIIHSIRAETINSKANEVTQRQILAALERIENENEQHGRVDAYKSLMSTASDHITVLGALFPYIAQLASALHLF